MTEQRRGVPGPWPARAPGLVEQVEQLRRGVALAEASRALAAPLECAEVLRTALDLAVPLLADAAAGWLVEDDGAVRGSGVAAADPAEANRLREAIVGMELDPLGPEGVPRVLRLGRSEVVRGWPPERGRTRADRRPRSRRGRSFLAVPLVGRRAPVGALVIATDPPRRADSPDTVTLAEDLGWRAGLAVENARLFQRAQLAAQARDEYLAAVSHDLAAPLTLIKSRAQLLRIAARTGRAGASQLDEGLGHIEANTSRMGRMLNELRDLIRLQAGEGLPLARRPTDLVALAKALSAEYALLSLSRRHTVRVEATQDELVGDWDGYRIERVLGNLLANAVKYSDAGEVVVRVARAPGNWAVLEVQDQGIGIPSDELARVFEPFRRATNAREAEIPGSGIGLAVSRRIVEQHGGTIDIASEVGRGTVVTVRLPLDKDGAASVA